MRVGLESTHLPGSEFVLETDSKDEKRGVVFEDEGETGYFYARDYSQKELFVDALHIYTVELVRDKDLTSEFVIIWSADETKAALLINQHPHAVFDFTSKIGYSRDNFPEPDPTTGWEHQPWVDKLRRLFE